MRMAVGNRVFLCSLGLPTPAAQATTSALRKYVRRKARAAPRSSLSPELSEPFDLRCEIGITTDPVGRVFARQNPDVIIGLGSLCIPHCTLRFVADNSLAANLGRKHDLWRVSGGSCDGTRPLHGGACDDKKEYTQEMSQRSHGVCSALWALGRARVSPARQSCFNWIDLARLCENGSRMSVGCGVQGTVLQEMPAVVRFADFA